MDKELIERLAKDAYSTSSGGGTLTPDAPALRWICEFAALIAEECAKVCEAECSGDVNAAKICAENIREKFKPPQ